MSLEFTTGKGIKSIVSRSSRKTAASDTSQSTTTPAAENKYLSWHEKYKPKTLADLPVHYSKVLSSVINIYTHFLVKFAVYFGRFVQVTR